MIKNYLKIALRHISKNKGYLLINVPQAVADISQVQEGVRLNGRDIVVKTGEQLFSEHLTLVDPNFLEVFTYTMEMGAAAVLKDPSQIILTKKIAQKYFGDTNPIGKIISINPTLAKGFSSRRSNSKSTP